MDKHLLKLTGKAESDAPIQIGHNYKVVALGSVVSESITNGKDGIIRTATFKPVQLTISQDMGEALRLSDTRGMSEQFRSILWRIWKEREDKEDFNEVVYPAIMKNLIKTAPDIYQMYFK